jgi:hypothetical protein
MPFNGAQGAQLLAPHGANVALSHVVRSTPDTSARLGDGDVGRMRWRSSRSALTSCGVSAQTGVDHRHHVRAKPQLVGTRSVSMHLLWSLHTHMDNALVGAAPTFYTSADGNLTSAAAAAAAAATAVPAHLCQRATSIANVVWCRALQRGRCAVHYRFGSAVAWEPCEHPATRLWLGFMVCVEQVQPMAASCSSLVLQQDQHDNHA